MSLPRFNNARNTGSVPPYGHATASYSSPLFVLNTNAEVVTSADAEDLKSPYRMLQLNTAGYANIRPAATSGEYVDLHVYTVIEGQAVATTAPVINMFGRTPRFCGPSGDRLWPSDVDPANYADPDDEARAPHPEDGPMGLWIPLPYLTLATGIYAYGSATLPLTIDCILPTEVDAANWSISTPVVFPLLGCIEVICSIVTAAAAPATAMIAGRFVAER